MKQQDIINYERIERAIAYITSRYKQQPSLAEIAQHVHMSPAHFQRLFVEWAGTTPKKFLQYISIQHAKQLLSNASNMTLFDATYAIGLSSTSRLHDLFISIEGMTPAEYKHGGKNLTIFFEFYDSPFGSIIIASTTRGICHMAFYTLQDMAYEDLKTRFPNAAFIQKSDASHLDSLAIFNLKNPDLPRIKLHLKGTDFQLKVWEALLKIPSGKISTYGAIAEKIEKPQAHRAVGTAIGRNPVAFLIPCHRVVQRNGVFGGYRWGSDRKTALIGWEQALLDH